MLHKALLTIIQSVRFGGAGDGRPKAQGIPPLYCKIRALARLLAELHSFVGRDLRHFDRALAGGVPKLV